MNGQTIELDILKALKETLMDGSRDWETLTINDNDWGGVMDVNSDGDLLVTVSAQGEDEPTLYTFKVTITLTLVAELRGN